jgi:CO/xanthine dehydrogenase FAD-binding subunit
MSFRERPAVTVAANVTVRDGRVAETRLAVGSVGVAPVRLPAAEELLVGADAGEPEDEQLLQFAHAAADAAQPVADANGSVEYKRQLVRVLAGRCAREAVGLAHEQPAA